MSALLRVLGIVFASGSIVAFYNQPLLLLWIWVACAIGIELGFMRLIKKIDFVGSILLVAAYISVICFILSISIDSPGQEIFRSASIAVSSSTSLIVVLRKMYSRKSKN